MITNKSSYKASEQELLKRAQSVKSGNPELTCCITSEMSSDQKREMLLAARNRARAFHSTSNCVDIHATNINNAIAV
ncbi:TPA: hypothetical protein RQK55_000254 [Vibrio vulnificus]|nr:hypothetical protein [Vibrio vulnificus]